MIPKSKIPNAPAGLSTDSKRLWRELQETWVLTDAASRDILTIGLRARDALIQAEVEVKKSGQTVQDRWGQVKSHPLLATARDLRSQILAAYKLLGLNLDPLEESK